MLLTAFHRRKLGIREVKQLRNVTQLRPVSKTSLLDSESPELNALSYVVINASYLATIKPGNEPLPPLANYIV